MNQIETLTTDTIKLFNNSNVFFGLDVPYDLKPTFDQKVGNGFRPALIDKLECFSEVAAANGVEPVAQIAKEAANQAASEEKFSIDNIGTVMKLSLSAAAAAIPYQKKELNEQAAGLLDTVGKYIPGGNKIHIGWEISPKRKLDVQAVIKNKATGFLVPFNLFMHRWREPFLNQSGTKDLLLVNPDKALQAKKILLLMLKRLFWYSSRLVEEWRNVDSMLVKNADAADRALKIIQEGKWFILEYKPEKLEAMLKWIEALHLFAAQRGDQFVKVAVLADYRRIDTPQRPRLRGYFGEAGSTFERFPDGIGTFLEAIRRYDHELAEGIKRREQIRMELASGEESVSSTPVKRTAKSNRAAV